jgi:hypothetical protein
MKFYANCSATGSMVEDKWNAERWNAASDIEETKMERSADAGFTHNCCQTALSKEQLQ